MLGAYNPKFKFLTAAIAEGRLPDSELTSSFRQILFGIFEHLSLAALPALLLLFAAATACSAQTPQKIINQYIQAEGGAGALGKIQSVAISGSLQVVSPTGDDSAPQFGSYSLITKAPNKLYSEIIVEPRRMIAAYNGKSAWGQDFSTAPHTLTGTDAVQWEFTARYLNTRLLNAKKDEIVARLIGTDSVRGRPAYHLQFSFAPGIARDIFFDAQTHLIVREIVDSPAQPPTRAAASSAAAASLAALPSGSPTASGTPAEQYDYDDYQPVKGIQEPRKIELRRGDRDYLITVTRVEINSPVNDATFDFPRLDSRPLPDIAQLLRDIQKNQKTNDEIVRQYTCHLVEEEGKSRSNGDITPHSVKEYDIFYVGEDEIRHLQAKDGKPLEGDEKKKEDQRFNKEFDEARKKQVELANDPKKQQKEEEREEAQISDFLRAERFTNPRRELFRGQEVIVFDFGPNPDYKPKSLAENLVQKLVGVVWVDEQVRDVARLEARMGDNFKVGGGLLGSVSKGSTFVFEQTMVNNEVWLPSYDEIHANARLVFVKMKANLIDHYSNYKKFSSEVRLGSSTPAPDVATPDPATSNGATPNAKPAPENDAAPKQVAPKKSAVKNLANN
ncbi:MAG: hypothetical protein WCA91_12895 [Candidatus Acidiferrales bacterium]